MTRINLFRNTAVRNTSVLNTRNRRTPAIFDSIAWDSIAWGKINLGTTASPLVFAAILIVCSFTVGCSSDKPKTVSSTNQTPVTQTLPPAAASPTNPPPIPTTQASAKPVHKKVTRRSPTTVTYIDKTSGVSFQYPRRYALKTADAADKLISSDPVPVTFTLPGGVALAAVEIPEGVYPKTDLASASFDVSLNKALTEEQCGEFSQEKPSPVPTADGGPDAAAPSSDLASSKPPSSKLPQSKLKVMIGDMELQSTETLASVGTGQEAAKYYHAFENGTCYEFALKIATTGVETDEGGKHVDRDEIFKKLETILATVKISPVKESAETASLPAASTSTATTPATPAQ